MGANLQFPRVSSLSSWQDMVLRAISPAQMLLGVDSQTSLLQLHFGRAFPEFQVDDCSIVLRLPSHSLPACQHFWTVTPIVLCLSSGLWPMLSFPRRLQFSTVLELISSFFSFPTQHSLCVVLGIEYRAFLDSSAFPRTMVPYFYFVLKQDLAELPRLASNSLGSLGWLLLNISLS